MVMWYVFFISTKSFQISEFASIPVHVHLSSPVLIPGMNTFHKRSAHTFVIHHNDTFYHCCCKKSFWSYGSLEHWHVCVHFLATKARHRWDTLSSITLTISIDDTDCSCKYAARSANMKLSATPWTTIWSTVTTSARRHDDSWWCHSSATWQRIVELSQWLVFMLATNLYRFKASSIKLSNVERLVFLTPRRYFFFRSKFSVMKIKDTN